MMELSENLEQTQEVPVGVFNWQIEKFLDNKGSLISPSFKFGNSNCFLTIAREASIFGSSLRTCRFIFLTTELPDGISVFSKVTFYTMSLINPSGQEFQSGKGTLYHNDNLIIPMYLKLVDLRKFLLPEDTITIRLSWYSFSKTDLYEEGTQTTLDSHSVPETSLTLLEKLSNDLRCFYDNKADTDCVLKVGDVQFPAHRSVLAARSSTFAAIFHHETAEKRSGVVDIQDIESGVVGDVLKYIYSGKIQGLNADTAASMYEFAYKYAIFELKDHCIFFLKNNITMENVCDAAVLANTHEDTELEGVVAKFIEDNMEELLQSNAWKHFVRVKPLIAIQFLSSSLIACKHKKTKEEDL